MFNILDLLRDVGATIGTDNNQCEVIVADVNKWRSFVNNVKTLNQDIAKLSEERDALQAKLDVETHMAKLHKSYWEDSVQQRDFLQEDFSNLEKSYERLAAERNALQSKLDSGVRVYAAKNGLGYGCVQLRGDETKDHNATLILDEVNEPPNT